MTGHRPVIVSSLSSGTSGWTPIVAAERPYCQATRAGLSPSSTVPTMNSRLALAAFSILAASLLTGCSGTTESTPTADQSRQDQVRTNGTAVMPFDLGKTTHTFTNVADGGDQTVTVRDLADSSQLELIREHLREIADEFSAGNFTDPAAIHGADMPGLATLQSNPGSFTITYIEQSNGAKLEYRSTDQVIVAALHDWFDAQLTDHGSDATPGSPHLSEMTAELMCAHHPETCTE